MHVIIILYKFNIITMKKSILALFLLLSVALTFGQTVNSGFEGLWKPTSNNKVNISFWKDKENNIQTKQYDTRDGEVLHIISINVSAEEIIVEAMCESTQWYSNSVYSMETETGMLKCVTTNQLGSFESYYEKQTNN